MILNILELYYDYYREIQIGFKKLLKLYLHYTGYTHITLGSQIQSHTYPILIINDLKIFKKN